jgi:ABC-type iron transport system FetAB permease component
MESNEIDRDAAAAQLAALQADRAALADRVMQPWWYDVCLGLLLFGFLASYAFDSHWVTSVALVVFFGGLAALVAAYKRITGVWVTTDRRSMVVWGVLVLVVLVPALVLSEGYDQHWAMVVAGAVLGVAVAVFSRRWGRAWVAELQRGEL